MIESVVRAMSNSEDSYCVSEGVTGTPGAFRTTRRSVVLPRCGQRQQYQSQQCGLQRQLLVKFSQYGQYRQRVQLELQFGQCQSAEQQQPLQRLLGASRLSVSRTAGCLRIFSRHIIKRAPTNVILILKFALKGTCPLISQLFMRRFLNEPTVLSVRCAS